jgi:hypothetical protein
MVGAALGGSRPSSIAQARDGIGGTGGRPGWVAHGGSDGTWPMASPPPPERGGLAGVGEAASTRRAVFTCPPAAARAGFPPYSARGECRRRQAGVPAARPPSPRRPPCGAAPRGALARAATSAQAAAPGPSGRVARQQGPRTRPGQRRRPRRGRALVDAAYPSSDERSKAIASSPGPAPLSPPPPPGPRDPIIAAGQPAGRSHGS